MKNKKLKNFNKNIIFIKKKKKKKKKFIKKFFLFILFFFYLYYFFFNLYNYKSSPDNYILKKMLFKFPVISAIIYGFLLFYLITEIMIFYVNT